MQLRPGLLKAHINHAKALIGLGEFEQAVSAYRSALEITPDDLETHQYLNATLERMGRLDDALAGYERMLALSPGNPDIQAARARIFEIQGDKKRACETLYPLIEQYPDNPKIAVAFATVCKEAGKCDDAIRMLEAIIASPRPGLHQELQKEIHVALGRLHDDRSDFDRRSDTISRQIACRAGALIWPVLPAMSMK